MDINLLYLKEKLKSGNRMVGMIWPKSLDKSTLLSLASALISAINALQHALLQQTGDLHKKAIM